jgi:hypothetical protein
MTRDYIRSSLDVYPIEFLDMKLQHILVYGEDVLEGIAFAPDNLRLQLERELKGKLLHLRQGYLDVEGKGKALRELIRVSLTAFLSAFKALLVLKGREVPLDRSALIAAVSEAYGIDRAVFAQCLAVREGRDGLADKALPVLFGAYTRDIGLLCEKIDRFQQL